VTTSCNASAPSETPAAALASLTGGGRSSTGTQSAWLMIPAFAFFMLRRRAAKAVRAA
jgi:hypothetical protein